MNIALIGAGNIGQALAAAFTKAGIIPALIWSRNENRAVSAAAACKASYTNDLSSVPSGLDFYIICVPDDVVPIVASQIHPGNGIVLHTAGSVDMDVLSHCADRYGVFYPLQSFSHGRQPDFSNVPLCIEASDDAGRMEISALAEKISSRCLPMTSAERRKIHLAAVFANNFVNANYAIAARIAAEAGLDAGLLCPLILETAAKAVALHPLNAQTGPAKRGDRITMEKQKTLLGNSDTLSKIYQLMSDFIIKELPDGIKL